MSQSLILHSGKKHSDQEVNNFLSNAQKDYKKVNKKPHGGFEIDITHFIGKSLEYKKSFALLLLIKKLHVNSMVYNYSTKSLAQKTNLSQYVIETYIKRLISFDMCHFNGKHLQLASLNKIMPNRSKGIVIHVSEKSTINSIIENINIELIKNNFSKQDRLRIIKSDLINSRKKDAKINLRSYKKSLKIANLHPEIKDEKLIDINLLGMRKIAEVLGCSLDYAARFILNLVSKKLIQIKRIVKKYADFSFSQFSSDELKNFINKKSGYLYSFKGCTYHYLGTQIEFI